MTPSDAALRTHSHCFPCLANKAPACPRGFHAATNDPATLRDLWQRHPGPLVGVAAGPRSGIVCLDIDCGDGKANAASARAWLAENEYRLPITWRHETQSGGIHVLFKHAPRFRCSASLIALGVDTKGKARADKDGRAVDVGYFIFWPAAGTRILVLAPLAPAPPWLIDLLNPKPKPASAFPKTKAGAPPSSASLRGALHVLARAREGGRNSALYWVSCRMGEAVRAGVITEFEALALLTSVARQVGLLDREIVRTAGSSQPSARKRPPSSTNWWSTAECRGLAASMAARFGTCVPSISRSTPSRARMGRKARLGMTFRGSPWPPCGSNTFTNTSIAPGPFVGISVGEGTRRLRCRGHQAQPDSAKLTKPPYKPSGRRRQRRAGRGRCPIW